MPLNGEEPDINQNNQQCLLEYLKHLKISKGQTFTFNSSILIDQSKTIHILQNKQTQFSCLEERVAIADSQFINPPQIQNHHVYFYQKQKSQVVFKIFKLLGKVKTRVGENLEPKIINIAKKENLLNDLKVFILFPQKVLNLAEHIKGSYSFNIFDKQWLDFNLNFQSHKFRIQRHFFIQGMYSLQSKKVVIRYQFTYAGQKVLQNQLKFPKLQRFVRFLFSFLHNNDQTHFIPLSELCYAPQPLNIKVEHIHDINFDKYVRAPCILTFRFFMTFQHYALYMGNNQIYHINMSFWRYLYQYIKYKITRKEQENARFIKQDVNQYIQSAGKNVAHIKVIYIKNNAFDLNYVQSNAKQLESHRRLLYWLKTHNCQHYVNFVTFGVFQRTQGFFKSRKNFEFEK